ncbi:hypothetical protein KA344_16150 [bacterium]|jgi:hypothetical protein|nr:hypothetical protein [bacterium]
MKPHNPKAIADKYYGDPFSRKAREGKRCCLFGPSIFKSGYGGAMLLIDKETLTRYEINSGMMRYGDLPFLDYENRLGLFSWPREGGAPIADDEKILLKQIADLRQSNWQASAENIKLLAALLDQQAASYLKLKEPNFSDVEKILLEAISIQMQHPKLFSSDTATPLDRYLKELKLKGRSEEIQLLEAKWQAARSGDKVAAIEATAHADAHEETGNIEAEQLLFDAAEAEDANNQKLAEELYKRAITVLLRDKPNVIRDSFLMLAYSALGHLLVAQKQFLTATEPLASSIAFFQTSEYKQELMLSATVCVQLLGECLTELGRTDELAALAAVMDEARK